MDHFIPFCKTMGFKVEGREMELLASVASLEANRKKGRQQVVNMDGEQEAGKEAFL